MPNVRLVDAAQRMPVSEAVVSVIRDALRILARFFGLKPGPDVERIVVRKKLSVTPEQMADGRGVKFTERKP